LLKRQMITRKNILGKITFFQLCKESFVSVCRFLDVILLALMLFVFPFGRFENMYFNEFYYAKEQEPELKELQKKTRYYQGEIMVFNRNKDKEALIEGRKEAMDAQALEKLKKNVKAIDEANLEKHKAVV